MSIVGSFGVERLIEYRKEQNEIEILEINLLDELGLPFDRTYVGTKVLPNHIIERISDLMFYRSFYLGRIENRTKSDSILISEIKSEINLEL